MGVRGAIARRLVPAIVVVPLVSAWFSFAGQRAGWYGTESAAALVALVNTLVIGALIWANARVTRHAAGERKQAAQSLRDSGQLLQSIMDNSATVIYVKDFAGRYVLVNRVFEDLLHVTHASILGKTDYDLFTKEEADAFRAVDLQVAASGNVVEAEEVVPLDDGLHTYNSIKFPVLGPTGEPYAVAGISTDITERKRGELALRENEERTRLIVENALDAVITIDCDGIITGWNSQAEATFGWSHTEVIGRPLGETVIPIGYREAHTRGLYRYQVTGEAVVLGKRLELSAVHRDGHEFPIELAITPILIGDRISFSAFVRDITERKQAEQKIQAQLARLALLSRTTHAIGERQDLPSILQVVVESLEDHLPIDFGCVCLYDATRESLTVSSIGAKSQGLAFDAGMADQPSIAIDQNGLSQCALGKLVYEPDVSEVDVPFTQGLARGGLRSLVLAPLMVQGNLFGVLVAARTQPQNFTSIDCEFLRQLSEHVALAAHQAQLHSALQQAYEELRQTQRAVMQQERLRALGQMASGVAHDINNAISPAALYVETLLEAEPNLSPRGRGYLTTIGHAIDDVAATVARMREFYRQREPEATLAPVLLNDLVTQVVNLTRARWSDMPQQRGIVITMSTELTSDLPAVLGAENEIREALTNLIFNAVDAMPEGGALTVRTGVADDAKATAQMRCVRVEVTDTGVGMDEDTRRQCLEPFFTTKGERGTGLGLATVYGVVRRHGAEIEIDSVVGKGTTVRLSFPMPTTVVAPPARQETVSAATTGLSILVVDDDPLLLESLRDTLERDGHTVVTADSGQAGIDAFWAAQQNREPFEVVITDLGMPYMDGRKVASAIKDASASTPVILLTGWGQRLAATGNVPSHVDRVLSKPPKLRELRDALAACCQRARA